MRKKVWTAISVAALALVGVVLILAAVFYRPPQPHAVLWYWQEGKVYRYDTETMESTELVLSTKGAIRRASLSPDAMRLAYTDETGLWLAASNESTGQLLVRHEHTDASQSCCDYTTWYTPIGFSPDNNWLFVEEFPWEFSYVYLASTRNMVIRPIPPISTGRSLSGASEMSWSPDSQRFTFSLAGFGPTTGEGGVYVTPVEDLDSRRTYYEVIPVGPDWTKPIMTFEGGVSAVSWSPLGDRLAIVQSIYDPARSPHRLIQQVVLLNPDGSGKEVVYESAAGTIADLVWSTDGKSIFVLTRQPDDSAEIIQIAPASFAAVKLYSASSIEIISISPDNDWLALLARHNQENIYYDIALWILDLDNFQAREIVSQPVDSYWDVGGAGWEMTP